MLTLQHQFVGDGHPQTLRRPGERRDPQSPALMMTEAICPSAKSIRHGVWVLAFAGTTRGNMVTSGLIDRPDQGLDLVSMRAEVFRELVEIGIGDLLKARLVDIGD